MKVRSLASTMDIVESSTCDQSCSLLTTFASEYNDVRRPILPLMSTLQQLRLAGNGQRLARKFHRTLLTTKEFLVLIRLLHGAIISSRTKTSTPLTFGRERSALLEPRTSKAHRAPSRGRYLESKFLVPMASPEIPCQTQT